MKNRETFKGGRLSALSEAPFLPEVTVSQARLAAHAGRGAAASWPPPGRFRASTA